MDPMDMTEKGMKSASALSKNMIIGIAAFIGISLAVGLGVGLGVGLNKVEYVYVDATTKAPIKESTTTGGVVTVAPSTEPTTAMEPTTTVEPTTSTIPSDGPWMNFRLPDYIIPSHYGLTLHPNMTTDDYTGTNIMTINITKATKYILFHAHESLEITSTELKTSGGDEINIVNEFRYPEYEFYIIEAETSLAKGEYVLTVGFYNSLVKAIVGIYKSTYIDPDTKEEKGVVGSDMEPTDARRGYPCFDEPALKIRYKTTILHEHAHTALSNMPVESTEHTPEGYNKTVFQESVPMSTYLGCFVVAELDYKEEISGRGIPLRIYGSKSQIAKGQADYALQVTKAMFDNYEKLFRVNYTLPKYDQIAIPNFGTGAMENWGLVTYRETNLLWDKNESSTYYKQRVAAVVAHEMVHQWFGNIVTMKWWDNIWLNEGFASNLEYRGIKFAESEWETGNHFVIDDVQTAMRADSTTGSHPIVVNVTTPSQITEVFDTITYQKGSSILGVMNDLLGDDYFFGGLNRYLNNFMFNNTDEQDLWNSVQEYIDKEDPSSGINVKELMDPWVQQFGLPVVNVDTTTDPTKAEITQGIMLTDADADLTTLPDSEYKYKWNVKLDYFSQSDPTKMEVTMGRTDDSLSVNITGFGDWTKFNADATGYYRVNYDSGMWSEIVKQLQNDHEVFTEIDRANMLDDALNLAPAEKISYSQALNMTTYLNKEESYFVWRPFSSGSSYIQEMLLNTDDYENFKTYYLTRVKPIADKLGWDASQGTHEEKRMRPTVLGLALSYGDEEHLANATSLYSDWKLGVYIHPDVRQLVYRYGILGGTEEDWDYMLEKYKAETVASEKTYLLRGLAATEDVNLINRLLNYSKDKSIIRDQDFFTCITYISYSINGNKMAWSWVRINWDYMVERFGIENRSLGRLVPNIVEYYNTDIQKWEVENFFETEPEAGAGEMGRKNALIQLDLNIAWMATNSKSIGTWLQDAVASL